MRNENILLNKRVPKKIRLSVYEDALDFLKTNKIFRQNDTINGFGICLALPIILWDLEDHVSLAPNDRSWSYSQTEVAFPEISEYINQINQANGDLKISLRIECIEEAIKKLSN